MKKRLHILIILLSVGFFLSPSLGYSCGSKTVKSCCKKETSTKTEKKACCKNKQSKEKDSCGGKCGDSSCTSSASSNFSIISLYEIEFKSISFDFTTKKQKLYHIETFISSGFTSVWLPPKIK